MKKLRVLIVEDEENIAMAIKTVVSKNFYCEEVTIARDGEDAWNKIKAHIEYDLIIADWNMPRKSGNELLFDIRHNAKTERIPFLMLTARSDQESIVTAVQSGANGYIVKPFAIDLLIGKISKLLGIRPR